MSTTARESDGLELSFGPLICGACGCEQPGPAWCEMRNLGCRCHVPSGIVDQGALTVRVAALYELEHDSPPKYARHHDGEELSSRLAP